MSKPQDFAFEGDIKKIGEQRSDLAKVSELLLDNKFRRRKTILNRDVMVGAITTLDVIGQIYDIQFLKDWVPSYCEYLTSNKGQGRRDIVDITKFSIDRENQARVDMMNALGKR